jgi:alkyldihydroxyacetonephosphate synthase
MVDTTRLVPIVGSANVRTDADTLSRTVSAWAIPVIKQRQGNIVTTASAVVYPGSPDEVAAIVAWANETKTPLHPVGGLSNTVESVAPTPNGVAIDLARLNAWTLDEESLLVTVGAGVRWAELEETLNQQAYTLGQVPRSFKLLTVGGAIATNAVGALSGRYGRVGDIVQGMEVVTGAGEFLQLRKTANFDMLPLFIGSEGQFGVITTATLRIRPLPEVQAGMAFTFRTIEDAIDAARLIYRTDSRPTLVRVFDSESAAPFSPQAKALLIATVEGQELAQTGIYQLAHAICQTVGGTEVSSFVVDSWYSRWQETDFLSANAHPNRIAIIVTAEATWANVKGVEQAVRSLMLPNVVQRHANLCHPSPNGATWEFFIEAQTNSIDSPINSINPQAMYIAYQETITHISNAILQAGGSITAHYGIGKTLQSAMKAERGAAQTAIWKSMKAVFDPNNLLNPGVFV